MSSSINRYIPSDLLIESLLDDMEFSLICTNENFEIIYASLPAKSLFGDKSLTEQGAKIEKYLSPESARMLENIKNCLRINGETFFFNLTIIDCYGKKVIRPVKIRCIFYDNNRHCFFIFYFLDTKKTKTIDKIFFDVDNTLNRFLMSLSDAVLLIDFAKRVIINCNEAAEKLFGYTKQELLNRGPQMLIAKEKDKNIHARQSLVSYTNSGYYQAEVVSLKKDGSTFLSLTTNISFFNNKNKICYILSINRDITETNNCIKKINSISRQSQKLIMEINKLSSSIQNNSPVESLSEMGVSKKQIQIIVRLMAGEPAKSIAASIGISVSAIKKHLTALYRKFGVTCKVELIKKLHDQHIAIE